LSAATRGCSCSLPGFIVAPQPRAFPGGARSILTIAIRPTNRSSIDLVYHYYLQDKVSTRIRGTELDADPSGLSTRLGSEIDLIMGYKELWDIDAKWVLGYFIPRKAFPKADSSLFVNREIEWEF
jgi:hypothetical protein